MIITGVCHQLLYQFLVASLQYSVVLVINETAIQSAFIDIERVYPYLSKLA